MVVPETVNRERAKSTITAGKSAILAVTTIISGPIELFRWLDAEALLKDNIAKVLAVLQQGLASPEHADFVKRLSLANQQKT
jgi:hypothetical protein